MFRGTYPLSEILSVAQHIESVKLPLHRLAPPHLRPSELRRPKVLHVLALIPSSRNHKIGKQQSCKTGLLASSKQCLKFDSYSFSTCLSLRYFIFLSEFYITSPILLSFIYLPSKNNVHFTVCCQPTFQLFLTNILQKTTHHSQPC
jgi:hypothetical protein